jgi:cytochrome c-type biogenesis protein CcmH
VSNPRASPRAPAAAIFVIAFAAIAALSPTASLAATTTTTAAAAAPSVSSSSTTAAPSPASASVPVRASLPAIERRVMCVTCKIPLIVAESPQAERERVFIRGLIAEGKTESQIEQALVSQYGPTALGLPSTHGFDLTAYLVPLAAVLVLMVTLALLLPRWRRRAQRVSDPPAAPVLSATEKARLDADLARFDR